MTSLKTVLIVVFAAGLILGNASRVIAAPEDSFARGNAFYAAGNFPAAVNAYEAQVRQGRYSANLFYNLADSYYRQSDRGRAILNYQRALTLDPSHAEAAANLAFARGVRSITPPQTVWSSTLLPWLAAGLFWLAAAGVVIVLASRHWRGLGYGLLSFGLLASVAGIAAIYFLDDAAANPTRAVVVADSAPALYAPADNSKVITNLTAGGEVRILSDQGAWVYALLNDGSRAWVSSDKIERVIPN